MTTEPQEPADPPWLTDAAPGSAQEPADPPDQLTVTRYKSWQDPYIVAGIEPADPPRGLPLSGLNHDEWFAS